MSDRTRPESLPHVALSAHAHNRMGLQRTDEEWLAARMADPATRVLVVAGNRLRPVDGAIEWVTPDRAPDAMMTSRTPTSSVTAPHEPTRTIEATSYSLNSSLT